MGLKHGNTLLFADSELLSPDTGEYRLATGFGEKLVQLRLDYGHPMIVNSGARSYAYNRHVGGHPRSLHVYDRPYWPTGGCAAVDIAMTNPILRARLVRIALTSGWAVGIHPKFVHLDRRQDFTDREPLIFLY